MYVKWRAAVVGSSVPWQYSPPPPTVQCYNLYGVLMILVNKLYAGGGASDRWTLSPSTGNWCTRTERTIMVRTHPPPRPLHSIVHKNNEMPPGERVLCEIHFVRDAAETTKTLNIVLKLTGQKYFITIMTIALLYVRLQLSTE